MNVIWELDFYSRPILDERQKKRWEVLVCESPTSVDSEVESLFHYSQFCANTEVNSVWLRNALKAAIEKAPAPPKKIRFFRRPMTNMIVKACEELGIAAQPSRRTLALQQLLDTRMQTVYPQDPNYQADTSPSVKMADSIPQPLPDELLGEKWVFVTLPAGAFAEMPDWQIDFGDAFPLAMMEVEPETPIPGLIVFSSRALPLAGWMSGAELAFLKLGETPAPRLLLESSANDCWILSTLNDPQLQAEARRFEERKQAANGVHFLAVQVNPETEAFAGFWLMREMEFG